MKSALAALALLAGCSGSGSASSPLELHYAPQERLDQIDAALIASATRTLDVAAYSLTDALVIDAVNAAETRGVAVRIVLEPGQSHDLARLNGDLVATLRYAHDSRLMHLKAFAVDGRILRTGSANLSTSGERSQDNDLLVIRDAEIAAQFEARFQWTWERARP